MKCVVLLSGGLDSSYNLLRAHEDGEVVCALTMDYQQRARRGEIRSAQVLCKKLNIPHEIVALPFFTRFTTTGLVNAKADIPQPSTLAFEECKKTAAQVWVPNRNGIFLEIAAGFAEGLGADSVVPGFNLEEAATFKDNSAEFLAALTESLQFSTDGRVRLHCFSTFMNKAEIIKDAVRLQLDFSSLWPCYTDQSSPCRKCESCQRFERALNKNNLDWPFH